MVDLIGILEAAAATPLVYLPLLLVFVVLATLVLPIPVEVGLLNPYVPYWWLLVVMAIGRGIGGWMVYPLGGWIGSQVDRWARRSPFARRALGWAGTYVGRHGYVGLFAILSIPFMVDTATLYAFAILNPRGPPSVPRAAESGGIPATGVRRLRPIPFALATAAGGCVRGLAFLAIPVLLGWP